MAIVSIIMPTYNCAGYIAESVESVLNQTFSDWELEIVDDCSTDDTYKVLAPYLDRYPNIHYRRFPKNRGPAAARTEAMRHATGKYIAFFDSDDLWNSNKLEKQIRFMEQNDCPFSCTAYSRIDESGNDLGLICYPPRSTDYNKMLLLSNPIGNTTVIYNQEKLGKYRVPDIRRRNDFALWLQILKDTPCCVGIQEVLSSYRIRSDSVSHSRFSLIKYHWQLYHSIEKLGLVRSAFYMCSWVFVKGTGIGLDRVKARRDC